MADVKEEDLAVDPNADWDPEVLAANAEVAAELARANGSGQPAADPAPQAQPEPEAISIPKERLDAVLRSRDAERDARLRLEGEIQALRSQRPTASAEPPPPVRVEDAAKTRIAAIDAELDQLGTDVDNGKIGLAEFNRRARLLNREADDIRYEMRNPGPASAPASASDAYVADQSRLLEQQNPWVARLPHTLLEDFVPMAARLCRASGLQLREGDPASDLALRRALVSVLAEHGYAGDQRPTASAQPGRPAVGQHIPTAGLSPDQLAAKMRIADRAVPSPATAGVAPRANGLTSADIDNMTEDQINALPDDVKEAIAATQ
jgi:hypothetical protein